MKYGKRIGSALIALSMMAPLVPTAFAADSSIIMQLNSNTMNVNGTSVKIDDDAAIKPQVKTISGKGYTMLPLRAIVEAMGGTVAYDTATKTITMTYDGNTVKHVIGTKTATVNGVSKALAIQSYAENNRTYVHLRTIELLSSKIAVNWSASAPNQVSITYPEVTNAARTVSLTIKNAASGYLSFSALKLAPAGSTNYSGSLIGSTLYSGASTTLTMAITPGKYDLQGTDINGSTYTWKNLDFSAVQSSAVLTLNSGALYNLTVDSKLTGDKTASVSVTNATGGTLTSIKVYPVSTTAAYATSVSEATTATGSKASFTMPYSDSAPLYNIIATFSTGNAVTYSNVKLGDANVAVTLRGDGTFVYGTTSSASDVYFVNSTGDTMKQLQMKMGAGGTWSNNLLSGSLKDGDYITLNQVSKDDVKGQTVYFRYSTSSTASLSGNGKNTAVSNSSKNSVTFIYNSSLDVKYDIDPKDGITEEGLYVYNDTGIDFDNLYVICDNDFDVDDYDGKWTSAKYYFDAHSAVSSRDDDYDPDDYSVRLRRFDDGDEELIDDWKAKDLASSTLYFMGEYTDSANKDQVIYGELSVGKSSKFDSNVYATLTVDKAETEILTDIDYDYDELGGKSSMESGLVIYNDTKKKIDKIYLADESITSSTASSKAKDSLSSIKAGGYKVSSYYDRYKDFSGSKIYYVVEFENGKTTEGSVSIKSGSYENACILVDSYSSGIYDVQRDWEDADSKSSDSEFYLYNNSGEDVDTLYIGVGSTKTKAENNSEKVKFTSFDDSELLAIDDYGIDDLTGQYVYIYAEFVSSKADDFEDTISINDDDYDNVLLKLRSTGALRDYYDIDPADYE